MEDNDVILPEDQSPKPPTNQADDPAEPEEPELNLYEFIDLKMGRTWTDLTKRALGSSYGERCELN